LPTGGAREAVENGKATINRAAARTMSESRNEICNRLARLGFVAQGVILSATVVLVAAPVVGLAYAISGRPGTIAAATAAGICLLGGLVALAVSELAARRLDVLQAVLIGMMARMAVPLLLGIAAHLAAPWLTSAGLFFYFLAFYVVVLAVETMFSMVHVAHAPASPKAM
jgi:hypothetical protein